MARNASGTMTLPAGNPVVTGTTISSTTHNNTLSDISTEITDSLSRSGKGEMLAALELANGTVAAPALTFDSDPDSGLYRIGANNLGLAVNGAKVVDVGTTGASITGTTTTSGQTLASDGTKTAPGVGFTSDVDTGLYRIGANNPAMSAGDTKVQEWSTTGSTFPLAATVTGLLTANAAISAAKTSGDVITATATTGGKAMVGVGAGNSAGAQFTGGATGNGVVGIGGSSVGTGVVGSGTGGGTGGDFTGQGSGPGVAATGGASGYGAVLTGNATKAPLRVAGLAGAPSSPADGDIYYDTGTGKFMGRAAGAWVAFH